MSGSLRDRDGVCTECGSGPESYHVPTCSASAGDMGAEWERMGTWIGPADIAYCTEHGLHGRRGTCFVCDGPVEQIRMVPVREVEALAPAEMVPAYRFAATRAVLAERERELLTIKGPCSTCRLHYAHAGPCDPRTEGD